MQDGILAYISIGSNTGDPLQNCREAIGRLSRAAESVLLSVSSFYRTEPVPVADAEGPPEAPEKQNWFVNAAVEIRISCFTARTLSGRRI